MSITIEQRLREMELVNEMLQAAMAEDGDEEDEVKEEYGRKMDEQLASLRTKLEDARRNEGKESLATQGAYSSSSEAAGQVGTPLPRDGNYHEDSENLISALSNSQHKVS